MATRFYLESSAAETIPFPTLARHTGWLTAAGPTSRFSMDTTKQSTALTNTVTVSGGPTKEICVFQFQCPQALAAQTISNANTINGIHSCLESLATGNNFAASVLYVVTAAGAVRGTFYDDTVGNSDIEMGTTASTRVNPADAFVGTKTSVVCSAGDFLVFELGFAVNSTGVSTSVTQRVGSSAASDFALTSGLTTDLNPWLEYSGAITFQPPSTGVNNSLMLLGMGT